MCRLLQIGDVPGDVILEDGDTSIIPKSANIFSGESATIGVASFSPSVNQG
ncbi:MAG: hypothetical protein ACTMUB_05655 [cyanobacterium endosymbiont of Rhopalodia musculus]